MLVAKMSIKELKEREKEQRRDYIVDAADKLFLSRGYDSVSMNDIADAVGMNKATLYLYFKSKESLFFSVVQRGVRLMEAQFREATAREQTGIGKVRAIGETFIAFSQKHPDHYRMFIYSSSDRFDWDCCTEAQSCHEMMHVINDIMCEAIEMGMIDGTIRKDMDPLEIAIFLMTATQNIVSLGQGFQADLKGRGFSYQQYVEHSMSLLGQAIEGREGAARQLTITK
jgi:TetR/AcrR family transcriptional regulator